jgi:CDP-diacylglycerol--serine O-phosphatidyltransferase
MKNLPNLFTLLNLIFGCLAIVFVLQTGTSIVALDNSGNTELVLPERLWLGGLFIFAAAVIDFLDGFLARIMKAQSEMGKQLDSLSDVVSFGVAPSIILYQMLRMSYAREENGLDVSMVALLPAFILAAAAAWRLAKFNISTNQGESFRGVPSPAAGLVVASLPLILWYPHYDTVGEVFLNKWFLYAIILLLSYLMVCNRSFMAMKFKEYSFRNNQLKYLLVLLAVTSIIFFQWLSVPIIFVLYLLVSIFPARTSTTTSKEQLDITV